MFFAATTSPPDPAVVVAVEAFLLLLHATASKSKGAATIATTPRRGVMPIPTIKSSAGIAVYPDSHPPAAGKARTAGQPKSSIRRPRCVSYHFAVAAGLLWLHAQRWSGVQD